MSILTTAVRNATAVLLGLFLVSVVIFCWIFLGSIIGTWLWNGIVPVLFGLPQIKFLQFFGLSLMLHILLPSSSGITKSS